MSRLRSLYKILALVVVTSLVLLSILGRYVRVGTEGNHQRNIISSAFKTLISPALEQTPNPSVHQRQRVNTSKGDGLQPIVSNKSSQDIDNLVSGLLNQFISTASLQNISETNPLPRNDRGPLPTSHSMYMKDHCVPLIQGTAKPIFLKLAAHYHPSDRKQKQYINSALRSCDDLRRLGDYIQKPLNSQEESFPIAYSILVYKDPEQVERLLHAIYRPQNHYCIHVDSKVRNFDTGFCEISAVILIGVVWYQRVNQNHNHETVNN